MESGTAETATILPRLPQSLAVQLFAGHQQNEALEICGRLRAAHFRNGLFSVLGEIPQQRGSHRLAQPVTRAAYSSGRVATSRMGGPTEVPLWIRILLGIVYSSSPVRLAFGDVIVARPSDGLARQ